MSYAIVVPVYRTWLSPLEQLCLLRLRHFFRADVYLAAPQGLCLDAYLSLWPELQVKNFDPAYFASVKTYNKLMLDPRFYESFATRYEWMLIHQLDAFLFHGDLESFCAMPFDYFGAPWVPGQWVHPQINKGYLLKLFGTQVSVGNGGLSLRRLAPTIALLTTESRSAAGWAVNEDAFFGYWGLRSRVFRSCPLETAARFSFESHPDILYEMTGQNVPFGCHGLPKYHQAFYAKLMRPLLAQMRELEPDLIDASMSELLGSFKMDIA
ncbi:DUF5672 family protein [Polaromonas sp. SM01]|uniref:DUF5672 family protein n=1 Tax=Polaromonas sp. SM01 TaxID=3085630 RepID=UPI002980D984|nr:DUF5672 family protein [Polaromonas sp. SM01]MDW5443935.1 DUF5672 family protein [Polaromonas sp. SM01]